MPPRAAQAVNIDLGTGAGLTERVVQLVGLMTVLSLAPSIVIMTTCFVRIVVVLSPAAHGARPAAEPAQRGDHQPGAVPDRHRHGADLHSQSYNAGIKPAARPADGAARRPSTPPAQPVKTFMLSQVDRDDLALFVRLSKIPRPANAQDTPLQVVTPAFMISELKRAFEIGFLLFVPFLVIDLVVASVLMSMGMMMLPPVVVSLPFKLIFFVLVDGWRLVAGSLVESFRHGPPGG